MIRTATAQTPSATPATDVLAESSIAALTVALDRFSGGDAAGARGALVDARAMVQELVNRDPENDDVHVAYNAIGTAGMLVAPITPQYAGLAIESLGKLA